MNFEDLQVMNETEPGDWRRAASAEVVRASI